jgi:hypothetical protein
LEYEIGSYNQFRIEIAFFRGVEEGEGSYFVIDNIQVFIYAINQSQAKFGILTEDGVRSLYVQKGFNHRYLMTRLSLQVVYL